MDEAVNKQDIIYVAIAIPVISYVAIQATKKAAALAGRFWGWFVRTIAGQTADAIREIVQPQMDGLRSDLMDSIEAMRILNSKEHVETQIRLRDVETSLQALRARVDAIVALTPEQIEWITAGAERQRVKEEDDAVAVGTSTGVDLQSADGGRRAGDRVRRDP